jgi:hypothetical protein
VLNGACDPTGEGLMATLMGSTITLRNGREMRVVGEAIVNDALRLSLDEVVVHEPPPSDSNKMPCCRHTLFEVPPYHRVAVSEEVTCGKDWRT